MEHYSGSHGIFNGTQTLLSILKGKAVPYRLEAMFVEDYPDLLYRGQMIDKMCIRDSFLTGRGAAGYATLVKT